MIETKARIVSISDGTAWVKPSEAMLQLKVHATPLSRIASDHLPIVATVALPQR